MMEIGSLYFSYINISGFQLHWYNKHNKIICIPIYGIGPNTWKYGSTLHDGFLLHGTIQQYILYKQYVGNNIDVHNCDRDFIQKY